MSTLVRFALPLFLLLASCAPKGMDEFEATIRAGEGIGDRVRLADLKGRVEIKFIIAPTGAVQNSVVSKTEVGNQVAQCIANAVRRWTFPSPEGGGIVSVTYPWTFSAGN